MIRSRKEAIEYLDSMIGSGIRPGLDRMTLLLDAAGHPERVVPAVLIAGTNGKGSTAATLSSIVHQAGYRVGLYTSPHLVDLEERWRIGERPVGPQTFLAAVRRLRECEERAGLTPTYFEALTLLAFLIFEMTGCSIAILEVGMGGRLDATNVVDPVASVITPIDLDHQEWLGGSIEEIAREKVGIARPRVPLVLSPQSGGAARELQRMSRELGCELHDVSVEVGILSFETGLEGSKSRLETPLATYEIRSPLVGKHQTVNLATAVRAAEIVSNEFVEIGPHEIIRGCLEANWRGRLESFRVSGRLVVVDGAHNPAGARSAARFVEEFAPAPRVLVFGVLEDKDAGSMLEPLVSQFDEIILTTPDSDRARRPDTLVEVVGQFTGVRPRVVASDVEAIREALTVPGMACVIVCGSLYLAGTAVRLLDQMASPRA